MSILIPVCQIQFLISCLKYRCILHMKIYQYETVKKVLYEGKILHLWKHGDNINSQNAYPVLNTNLINSLRLSRMRDDSPFYIQQ